MNRLTEGDEQGNWMLKGVAWKSLHTGQVITKEVSERLYGALCKLRDYEESGLNPDEVEATVELLDAKPPERSSCSYPTAERRRCQWRKHIWRRTRVMPTRSKN